MISAPSNQFLTIDWQIYIYIFFRNFSGRNWNHFLLLSWYETSLSVTHFPIQLKSLIIWKYSIHVHLITNKNHIHSDQIRSISFIWFGKGFELFRLQLNIQINWCCVNNHHQWNKLRVINMLMFIMWVIDLLMYFQTLFATFRIPNTEDDWNVNCVILQGSPMIQGAVNSEQLTANSYNLNWFLEKNVVNWNKNANIIYNEQATTVKSQQPPIFLPN